MGGSAEGFGGGGGRGEEDSGGKVKRMIEIFLRFEILHSLPFWGCSKTNKCGTRGSPRDILGF